MTLKLATGSFGIYLHILCNTITIILFKFKILLFLFMQSESVDAAAVPTHLALLIFALK